MDFSLNLELGTEICRKGKKIANAKVSKAPWNLL